MSAPEYRLHRTPRWLRWARRGLWPRNLHSGERIREFVSLADASGRLGLPVAPHGELETRLARGEAVLKFGKTNVEADLRLLARYPDAPGEWNARNLETVGDLNHHLDLGRETWNLVLTLPEHRERLRRLFEARGRLFVKSVVKGHAGLYDSFEAFLAGMGDVSRMAHDDADLLVSEPIPLRRIEAATPTGGQPRTDEWRHHVYRGRRVATTHAFTCDPARTDGRGESANVAGAEAAVDGLAGTGFATSYVIDTGTLTDGSVAVIEANSFFSSGIYTSAAVRAVADALAGKG